MVAQASAAALSYSDEDLLKFEAAGYNRRFGGRSAIDLLRVSIREIFKGQITLVSSFGADSAVLLHMVSQIDPATPVVFVDTGKHFGETKRYRDDLVKLLGLTGVRSVMPDSADVEAQDPKGALWLHNTDACCNIRKVLPLDKALNGFEAWISGRKRHQADTRTTLQWFEAEDGRIKVNPLADWTAAQVLDYARLHNLPPHPLVAEGFPSIGCMPCTDKVAEGEDPRAGRWRGQAKTECGIHLPTHGQQIDGSGI